MWRSTRAASEWWVGLNLALWMRPLCSIHASRSTCWLAPKFLACSISPLIWHKLGSSWALVHSASRQDHFDALFFNHARGKTGKISKINARTRMCVWSDLPFFSFSEILFSQPQLSTAPSRRVQRQHCVATCNNREAPLACSQQKTLARLAPNPPSLQVRDLLCSLSCV